MVAQEYDFDICSGFAGGSQTFRCSWPVFDVFQLTIHWAKVQLCLVMTCLFCYAGWNFLLRYIMSD